MPAISPVLRRIYHATPAGRWLLSPVKLAHDLYRFRFLTEKRFIRKTFRTNLGYSVDLKNPKTLNEKLQWLKLNYRVPLLTICADKYSVRKYIEQKIGNQYLIPLILCTEDVAEITPENLPEFPFILKTTHNSGGVTIVRDKAAVDWRAVRKHLAKSLKSNYYYRSKEFQYKDIRPRIVAEKLILDDRGDIPIDYKLHCFNGAVTFIQVDMDRYYQHKRNIYDVNWKLMDCKWLYENGRSLEPPELLGRMKELAQTLAEDFCYVRVDFYCVGSQIYFGELTFHPESGFGAFKPSEWDRRFGDMLMLSPLGKSGAATSDVHA
jgi:hypothetical protein